MQKIPTLFERDFANNPRYVTRNVTPGCEWVIAGEGVPTRKFDGTCVMFDGEHWWARREVKLGKQSPDNFVEVEHDETTGNVVGWEPVEQSGFYKYMIGAVPPWPIIGTYELCGPNINGNPEGFPEHVTIAHSLADILSGVPRDFDGLRTWLHAHPFEGIVFHRPDGRMCKIKRRDFEV